MRAHRAFGRSTVACLVVIGLTPVFGCQDLRQVKVLISDYFSSDVKGVTIWSQDAQSGTYLPQSVYRFGKLITDESGSEYVKFTVADDRLQVGVQLAAPVTRDPANPESLIVELSVLRSHGPDLIRASTYNDVGESDLSDGFVDLAG